MGLKVAIVTFLSDNYGTCLQAYALQKACEGLGCESVILKHIRKKKSSGMNRWAVRIRFAVNSALKAGIGNTLRARNVIAEKKHAFSDFRNKNMKITSDSYTSLLPLVDKYDLFIAGSDMVWSGEYIDYADFYFLNEVPCEKSGSYAPSFGKGAGSRENEERIAGLLNKIRFLSCRERSGVELIRQLTGRDAALVCDPTLLFDDTQWKSFFSIGETKSNSILVNCFGGMPPAFGANAELIRNACGAKTIRYLNADPADLRKEWKNGNGAYGPLEFIQMVNDCAFTIVNGYHGLLFALIFEKPFFVLHRGEAEHWSEHENRMEELLSYLNLTQRYIYPGDKIEEKDLTMDYGPIREKIRKLREESWKYLTCMMEAVENEAQYDGHKSET